jgi:hypothetical protein
VNSKAAIAAVVSVFKGVAGAGPNIYDSIRYTTDPEKQNELFNDNETVEGQTLAVHTWMLTREATAGSDEAMQAAAALHQIVANGYRVFQDGISEGAWQDELDAIAAQLLSFSGRHLQTEGDDVYFDWSGPPRVEGVKLVFFGNTLCHTARIIHPVREFPLS